MYMKTPVLIPYETKKIVQTKASNGEIYIGYTTATHYDPATKKSTSTRKGIGKMVPGDNTMMYPNETFFQLFKDRTVPEDTLGKRSRCINIGSFIVFQKLIHESRLDEIMPKVFGDEAGFALDLAMYNLVSQSNVMQFYTNYAKTHPVLTKKQKMYSDSTVSNFFQSLGMDRKDVEFLNEWTAIKDKNGRIYISYDSTNKRCESGNITLAEPGHAKKGEGNGKIINISVGYDHVNKEPVFYETYSGSIVDVSELKTMLKKAKAYGFDHIGVILDRGYFSRDNIQFMDKNNVPYIIMVKGLMPWIQDMVLDNMGKFEHDGKHRIEEKGVNGMTIFTPVSHVTDSERYCHLYYSPELDISETKQVDKKIGNLEYSLDSLIERGPVRKFKPEMYNKLFKLNYEQKDGKYTLISYSRKDEEIDKLYKLCGYFVIVTTENMSAKEALITYKNRDEVEKLFRANKRFARSEKVSSNFSVYGKTLVEFIAMILYSRFVAALERASIKLHRRPNYFSSTAALQELEKITMIADPTNNYQLETTLSKAQKEILDAFDIKYDSIRRYGEQISQILCKRKKGELLPMAAKWFKGNPQNSPSNPT